MADIGAVFVFNAEEGPHASSTNFAECNTEGRYSRVLQLEWYDRVQDPVEP